MCFGINLLDMSPPIVASRKDLSHCDLFLCSKKFIISVIYNSYHLHNQCFLWHELSKITTLHLPWLILGNFDAILARHERRVGFFSSYIRKARSFLNFVESNNLLDLKYSSSQFTWSNNQSGSARRWARLDRCLVNVEWNSFFISYNLKHLSCAFSDHSPLLLFVCIQSFQNHKIFRFENFWLDYVGCHSAVHEAWCFSPHGNPMQAFSHSRFNLNAWSRSRLSSIVSALVQTEMDI